MAFELEKRARIPASLLVEISRKLETLNAGSHEEFRFTLVNVPNARFAQKLSSLTDVKLRTDGKTARLTVKQGSWHKDTARIEHEVFFDNAQFQTYLNIMVCLEKYYWIAMYTHRTTYEKGALIYTLDQHYFSGDTVLEIEAAGNSAQTHKETIRDIDTAFRRLGLRAMNSAETRALIRRLNSVRRSRINFLRLSVAEFVIRFANFINCEFRW